MTLSSAGEHHDHHQAKGNLEFKFAFLCPITGCPCESYSTYGVGCIRCNDDLIAPDRSRYVSEHHISHSWSCERCGNQFETSDYLRLNTYASEPLSA